MPRQESRTKDTMLSIPCLDFQAEVQEMLVCTWWQGTTEGWLWRRSCFSI